MILRLRVGLRMFRDASIPEFSGGSRRTSMPTLTATDWSKVNIIPSMKTDFKLSSVTTSRSDNEIAEYYKTIGISVKGIDPPKPLLTFEECLSFGPVSTTLKAKSYVKPTPIQSVSWPVSLSGRDLVGNVRTGSGKTLAFLLPAMLHIKSQPPTRPGDGPTALILAPTRELAEQTSVLAREIGPNFGIRNALICGGQNKMLQMGFINRCPQLYVATPGRLIDFMSMGLISFRRMTYLVIDEADRMLDMGFEEQIRNIVKQIRPDRQTSMWSATWPKDVHALSEDFMKNPIIISEHGQETALNFDIIHQVKILQSDQKISTLMETIKSEPIGPAHKVMIFCNTKMACEIVSTNLQNSQIQCEVLHGDKVYRERQSAYHRFDTNKAHIIVATDVASRGLDLKGVTLVINYDMPSQIDDYVHRVGRTGRAGKKGKSLTFLTEADEDILQNLMDLLQRSKQEVPKELLDFAGRFNGKRQSYGRYRSNNSNNRPNRYSR